MDSVGINYGSLEWIALIDAVRYNKSPDTTRTGLEKLQKAFEGPGGAEILASYLQDAPTAPDVVAIWDAQLLAKDEGVMLALLSLLHHMLGMHMSARGSARQASKQVSQVSMGTAGLLDHLAEQLVSRRNKLLYRLLGSSIPQHVNAGLRLMSAAARRGAPVTACLLRSFDFGLPALVKLARVPWVKKGGARERLRSLWRNKDPLRRPVLAHMIDLGLALLQNCSLPDLSSLLPIRVVMEALLNHVEEVPGFAARKILATVEARVLAPDLAMPPRLRSEAFGDTALSQLATLASRADLEGLPAPDQGNC
eukprot:jgi/Botrbrau1/20454/Bobra.145_2s0018.1